MMDETAARRQSDYLLMSDDDVKMEPESIRRAATFADLARRPTIVGGHMFSLFDRAVLHAFAETIAPGKWWWEIAPNTKPRHDFGHRNLRNTPWLHRRADADYNGWWMCLIPMQIIAEIGLALPVFIKWDDAEYSVRAREHGYPTVSLPGMATWHVTWQDKTDALDWQAYYHHRNRIIAALLHSPHKRGGRLLAESAERQLQSLLSMQYSTAALRLLAIEDVLSGPAHLHRDLATRLSELQEYRRPYRDAQAEPDIESFPPARRKAPDNLKASTTPTNKINLLTKAAAGTMHQLRAPRKGARERPQMALPNQDTAWWVLSRLDSAMVSAADGASAAWYQRDRKLFRSLSQRSTLLHARLLREWPRLAAEYRAAAAEFTSPREVAGDVRHLGRDVCRRPARWAVSSTPTGQDDKTSAPGGREGKSAPRAAGAAGSSRAGTPAAIAARYAPPAAAAAAMTAAGLWGLTRDSAMGNDEVVSRWAALLSLRQLAHLLRHVDAVHGLYYLLLHGWMAVGTSPTVMRIPSVIFMAAAAALLAILGRRLTGSGWAGFFSGLIMALTPSITYYAQTARSYALVFACVLAATLALLHAMAAEQAGAPRPQLVRRWLVYGALVTLGGYLNELSLLVLGAHAVTVLLARYGRRTAAHWAVTAAAAAVLVAPLAALSSRQRAALGPIPRPGLHDVWVLLPQLLRRDDRGSRCCWPRAPSSPCCRRAAGGVRPARPRGPPGPGRPGGAAGASRCLRWPRRCSWSRPRSCCSSRWSGRTCTWTGTSCTARQARPCWPAAACTGWGSGWPTGPATERSSGCRAWPCASARCCCSSRRCSGSAPPAAACSTSAAPRSSSGRMRGRATG